MALRLSPKIRKYFYEQEGKFRPEFLLVIILGEGSSRFPSKNSFRLILMSFILGCIVLRAAYTSEMFIFLHSGANKVVTTLEDMAEEKMILNIPDYTPFYMPLNEIKYNPR